MSGINGDKSRFHRQRKQKIRRRSRNQEFLKSFAAEGKSVASPAESKPKAVAA